VRIIVVGGAGTIGKAAVKALIAVLHCVEDDDRGNPSASRPARSRPGAC
jgi:nucleoside-diphosphate-sugar epimerase